MSGAKHTPGPWKNVSERRVGSAGKRMAMVMADKTCTLIDCTESAKTVAESHANARLIAAAPELLEALTDAVCGLEHIQGHYETRARESLRSGDERMQAQHQQTARIYAEKLTKARAAIAKVTK